jgi:hypothetical protein
MWCLTREEISAISETPNQIEWNNGKLKTITDCNQACLGMFVHKEILRQSVGNREGQWNEWIRESRKIPCITPDFQMVVSNMESENSRESYILKPIFPVIKLYGALATTKTLAAGDHLSGDLGR